MKNCLQRCKCLHNEYIVSANHCFNFNKRALENEFELPANFWQRLERRVRGSRSSTIVKVPSNSELRRILLHVPIQRRALFLILESSGIRIGEALQLQQKDLKQSTENPALVTIRGEYTKTGNSRVTFMSREAVLTTQEWLKVRKNYLKAGRGKSHLYDKEAEDKRLFPFRATTAYSIWSNQPLKGWFPKLTTVRNEQQFFLTFCVSSSEVG